MEIIGTASKSKLSSDLPGGSARLGEVALDAAPVALGEFVLGHGGEEAGCRPAFLVGAGGEVWPHGLDGGQTQLVQHEAETAGVDRSGRVHAASPVVAAPSRLS